MYSIGIGIDKIKNTKEETKQSLPIEPVLENEEKKEEIKQEPVKRTRKKKEA